MRCENETEKENCEKRRRREGVKKATTRDGWADGGLMKGLTEGLRGSLKENIREQKCVRSHVAERERFKMAERGSMTKRVQIFRVDQSS